MPTTNQGKKRVLDDLIGSLNLQKIRGVDEEGIEMQNFTSIE